MVAAQNASRGSDRSLLTGCLHRQDLILPHDGAVVAPAILDRARLRIVVDVDDAEAPRVAPGPLEVVHQRPGEVALEWRAIRERLATGLEMLRVVARTLRVGDP